MGRLPPRDAGAWAEDGGERPRRSCAWQSQVCETITCLVVGHSGYAQPPVSVLPALRAPPSRVPYTRRALCAAQRSSPPCVGGLPRCSPARCWHEGRHAPTTAQTSATIASPLRCATCARDWAFVWRTSTATPRSCASRRSGETACSPVISLCSYAQTPAPAVPALSTPLFRRSPCSISTLLSSFPWQSLALELFMTCFSTQSLGRLFASLAQVCASQHSDDVIRGLAVGQRIPVDS